MEKIESFKVHVEAYPFQKGSVCGSWTTVKAKSEKEMPVWSAVGAKQSKLDCRPARQKHRWVLNYFWVFLSNYFQVINWIDCKSLCKFNSAQRVILYTIVESACLKCPNIRSVSLPFLDPSYVQLAREAQSKAVCTGLRQAGIGLASEISEGLFDVSRKSVENRENMRKPHGFGVRIPPSRTTCIFGQIKWHSFGIRPPQERIVHQAKFAENIHKVSSAEYSQPGKLHEDWRRHNKCFKFGANKLVVKADKSSKWYTIYKSSFTPLRVLLCGCGFFLIEAIPRCLWPENQLWRVRQSLPTSLNEVERSWLEVQLDFAQAEMIRQTFAMSCYVYLQHHNYNTYNKCHDKRNFMQLHRIFIATSLSCYLPR